MEVVVKEDDKYSIIYYAKIKSERDMPGKDKITSNLFTASLLYKYYYWIFERSTPHPTMIKVELFVAVMDRLVIITSRQYYLCHIAITNIFLA